MSTSYYWPGYSGSGFTDSNTNSREYTQALTGTQQQYEKYQDSGRVQSAWYNPRTGFIHVTGDNVERFDNSAWRDWPKVMNHEEYKRLKVLNASGKIDEDKAKYGFITPEFQDQALRFYAAYKAKGAAVITSSEFPQITVTTMSQALINRQQLVAQKYNLLGFPEKLSVPDTINVIFPEYNDTTSSVRVGYKENEAIDTSGYGAFTQTSVTLKKAGAGMAFTEEFYMRQTTVDIQSLLLDKIALDFTKARYTRIVAKLAAMTNLASTQPAPPTGGWAGYTAGNLQSNNRPYIDLNAVRLAINSDKLATVDTIITNEKTWMDYYTNTWIKGFQNPDAATPDMNQIITNPKGIPWCKQWIINEDIPNGSAYILDGRRILDIEGPRKTQQINTYNPDQTIFIQKEWFEIQVPTTRTTWGRILTGI